MKLLKVFNESYQNVLQILLKSFEDIPELAQEVATVQTTLATDPTCGTFHAQFVQEIDQARIEQIFRKDAAIILEQEVPFMQRCRLHDMYQRMYDTEHDVLWQNLQALCRYSSMVRACGTQLQDMEGLAVDFMANNQSVAPADYHTVLFKEMLSGGAMSQKLMATFKDPQCIKNILGNIGNIIKRPTSDDGSSTTGAGGEEFESLLKMTGLLDLQNINPQEVQLDNLASMVDLLQLSGGPNPNPRTLLDLLPGAPADANPN